MRNKLSLESSVKNVNRTLGARSRARRHALHDQTALGRVGAAEGRNNLLPALEQALVPLAEFKPPKRNARKIEPAHVAEVAESVARFGVTKPVLVDRDRRVIDGWVVVEAARQLGLTEVPCIVIDHLSPDEIRLLRIALNRLQEKGAWDLDILKQEFESLLELEIPLDITGFEAPEIDLVLAGGETSLDAKANAAPEIDEINPPVTRIGDLWFLDPHRVLCDDSCNAVSYDALMAGTQAAVLISDPPYNCPIDGFVGGKGRIRHREFVAASGEMSEAEFGAFLEAFLAAAGAHVGNRSLLYVFMDWRNVATLVAAGRKVGLTLLNIIVWSKPSGGMGGLYRSAHELIVLFKKGNGPHQDNVKLGKHGRDRTNVWAYPGAGSPGSSAREHLAEHPTPKPVELVADALLDVTRRDDIVLDPFLGSGTTIIAAEKARRIAYGLELDPLYVDGIIRRWETYTGKTAVHAATGMTFSEIAAARAQEQHPSASADLKNATAPADPPPSPDPGDAPTDAPAAGTDSPSSTETISASNADVAGC